MQSLDEIVLTGLTVFGRHGVFDHERRDGQDFTIDLRLRLSLAKAADSDEVTDTVHYGELAEKVAAASLDDRRVAEPVVTVQQPPAASPLTFADVAATITRRRRTTDAMEDTTA